MRTIFRAWNYSRLGRWTREQLVTIRTVQTAKPIRRSYIGSFDDEPLAYQHDFNWITSLAESGSVIDQRCDNCIVLR